MSGHSLALDGALVDSVKACMTRPRGEYIDELSTAQLVLRMAGAEKAIFSAVRARTPQIARLIDHVSDMMTRGGRLILIGAGTSGRLGVSEAAECQATFGVTSAQIVAIIAGGDAALTAPVPDSEDNAAEGQAAMDRLGVGPPDAVLGIHSSGSTPFVIGALERAKTRGGFTASLNCTPERAVDHFVDLVVAIDVGPEVVVGSSRIKSGSATKLVLNTISTGIMVRLGKVFEGQMVDMRPLNEKLRQRAVLIVASLTRTMPADAQRLLMLCGGEIKTAVLAHRGRCSPSEARARLEQCQGQLRCAIDFAATNPEREASPLGNDPSQFLLGVDAGGTKTVAAVAHRDRPGEILGLGRGGPANAADGLETAQNELLVAVERARRSAGCRNGSFARAFVGIAGAGDESVRDSLEKWMRAFALADFISVAPDAANVLAMLEPDVNAIALISGTGAIAFGRNVSGSLARAGGWGWITGHGGGGYSTGVAALRAVVRQVDGLGPATQLTAALQGRFGESDIRGIVGIIQSADAFVPLIASLAECVDSTAAEGDPVAVEILTGTAGDLASLVQSVAGQLRFVSPRSYTLCIAGNLIVRSEFVESRLIENLVAVGLTPDRVLKVSEPVVGALRAAAQVTG
jgi:N-acetylmuramic acid 6-phosphate etherase